MKKTRERPPVTFVLLTRFNLPSGGYEGLLRSDAWLKKRIILFERYCLPSVMAQTDQDFIWIVYFDPASPDWLQRKIKAWSAYGNFHALFRERVLLADKQRDMEERVGAPISRLLTANLDNDDGLATDFVASLRAAAPDTGRHVLTIEHGLVLSGHRLFLHRDGHNAFAGVVEDFEGAITCWAHAHNRLHDHMPSLQLQGPPGWLQVVHGDNVSNRVRGQRIDPAPYLTAFIGIEGAEAPCQVENLKERLVRRPARTVGEVARAMAKAIIATVFGMDGIDRSKMAWRQVSSLIEKRSGGAR
jgi:hypothetical protein